MRHILFAAAAVSAAACTPRNIGMTNADSTIIASKASAVANAGYATIPADGAAAMSTGPQVIVTVMYNQPKDAAAFEAYFPGHLKLVGENQKEIGFTKAELTKFTTTLDGKPSPFHRQAELYFPSMDAAKKGIASAGFKKVGDDLANFATGGLLALVAEETGNASETACPAIVTVIYETPKDAAAFEAYFLGHVKLVGDKQAEIGFTRADLTKFVSALDGSAAPKYRQAELCFPSVEARTKGLATPGFAAVSGDLANFATGGLAALLGEATN